jgi:hypothetical protein
MNNGIKCVINWRCHLLTLAILANIALTRVVLSIDINFIIDKKISFIFPIKSNRKVYLSESDKALGLHQPIGSLTFEEDKCLFVWLENVEFPLSITKQLSQR